MNIVKIILLAAILGIASTIQAAPNKSDFNTVIDAFIASRINTDYKTMKTILSPDAVEKFPRLKMTYRTTADDVLKIMKVNDGVIQTCTSSFKVLAESDGMIMAQVDFIYQEQIVSEFITLERDGKGDWKVTQINKFFIHAPEGKKSAPNS